MNHPSKCTDTQFDSNFPASSPPCLHTPSPTCPTNNEPSRAITPTKSQRRQTETYASPRPIPTAIYKRLQEVNPNQASFYILRKTTPGRKSRGRKSTKEGEVSTSEAQENQTQWHVARRSRRSLSRGRFHDAQDVVGVADSPRELLDLLQEDEEVKKEIGNQEVVFPASLTTTFPEPWRESMRVRGDRAFISLPPSPRNTPDLRSIDRKQTDRDHTASRRRTRSSTKPRVQPTIDTQFGKSPAPLQSPSQTRVRISQSPNLADDRARPVMISVPTLSHSTGVWLAYGPDSASSDSELSDSDLCMQPSNNDAPTYPKGKENEVVTLDRESNQKFILHKTEADDNELHLDIPVRVPKSTITKTCEYKPPAKGEEWKLCVTEEHSSSKTKLMRENALRELRSLRGPTVESPSVSQASAEKGRLTSATRSLSTNKSAQTRSRINPSIPAVGRLAIKSNLTPTMKKSSAVPAVSKVRPPLARRDSRQEMRALWPDNLTSQPSLSHNVRSTVPKHRMNERRTPLAAPKLPPSRRNSEKPRISSLPKQSATPTLTVTSLLKRLAQHSRELRGATPIDSTPVQRSDPSWMLTPMKVIPAHPSMTASENSPSNCILDHRQHSPIVAPHRKSLASIVRSNE